MIREMETTDLNDLIEMQFELQKYFSEIDKTRDSLPYKSIKDARRYMQKMIDDANTMDGKIFVAEEKDQIIGFIQGVIIEHKKGADTFYDLTHNPSKEGWVGLLFVKPEYRGGGTGQQLLDEMKKYFISKNCTSIRLLVLSDNKHAVAVYEKNGFIRHDLKRFRVYLSQKYNVNEAYYFIGAYDPKNQDLYSALQKFGYIVIFREHAESALSKKKGNADTDIVFTIMKSLAEKEKFDKVVLVSGDGDYWRMVDYLIQKDKFKKLLAPSRKNLSSLYKCRMADTYRVYLDDPAVRSKIEFKKK